MASNQFTPGHMRFFANDTGNTVTATITISAESGDIAIELYNSTGRRTDFHQVEHRRTEAIAWVVDNGGWVQRAEGSKNVVGSYDVEID